MRTYIPSRTSTHLKRLKFQETREFSSCQSVQQLTTAMGLNILSRFQQLMTIVILQTDLFMVSQYESPALLITKYRVQYQKISSSKYSCACAIWKTENKIYISKFRLPIKIIWICQTSTKMHLLTPKYCKYPMLPLQVYYIPCLDLRDLRE